MGPKALHTPHRIGGGLGPALCHPTPADARVQPLQRPSGGAAVSAMPCARALTARNLWRTLRVKLLPPTAAVLFGNAPSKFRLIDLAASLQGTSALIYMGAADHADDAHALGCRIDAPADAMATAVQRLRAQGNAEDVLLVALDCEWPRQGLARLLTQAAMSAADVLSPLGPEDDYTPLPEAASTELNSAAIDVLCHWLADPLHLPRARWASHVALWRGSAWRTLRHADPIALADCGLGIEAVASIYVGREGIRCRGAKAPEDRRNAEPASPLGALRERIGAPPSALPDGLVGDDDRPVLLHVLHGWGGGVERFVRDLAEGDTHQVHLALCASGQFQRRRYGETLTLFLVADGRLHPLRDWPLPAPIADTALGNVASREVLAYIVQRYRVARLMVSSLIGNSLDMLDSGLPTLFVCHDYYPLWPLLHSDFGDASQTFDRASLAAALKSADANSLPFQLHGADYWWQLRAAFIKRVRERRISLCAPSAGVRANWLRIAPELAEVRFELIPHGFRPFNCAVREMPSTHTTTATQPENRLRLLVLGRVNGGKALQLIEPALAEITAHADLYLIGCGAAGQALFGKSHVHIVLDYEREQLPALIERLRPDAALMPATVAESFSYTLSELWALGVPPIAARLGSLAERIEEGESGLLFAPTVDALAALLGALAADRSPLRHISARLGTLAQRSVGAARADYATLFVAAAASASGPAVERTATEIASAARSIQAMEVADLAESKMRLDAELQQSRHQLSAQQIELHARADWVSQAMRDTRRAQALLQTRSQQLDAVRAEFDERTRWALQLVDEAQRRQDEVRRLGLELQIAYDNHEKLDQEKRDADLGWSTEVARIEAQRQVLLNSKSWRMTRPLRGLGARARGARARIGYWIDRLLGLPPRLLRSLRMRGLSGTLQRIRQDSAPLPIAPVLADPGAEMEAPAGAFERFALPRSATPIASIIIPVYNKFPYTLACLQSIALHGARIGFEVIVVDDCSSDETADGLARIEGISAIHNAVNLGFIGACNAGAAAAIGNYLVFLNNDTQVTAGWLDALIDTFSQHRNVGLVGAKLVYPDGRLQEAGGIVFSDASGWNYGRFADPRDPAFNYVREVDYCSGAAIAISRQLFETRGGFDTRYAPAYYEDTDLAFQVREAGLRVLYQPASTVIHFEGITSGTDTASGTKRYQVINQQKFAERWRDALIKQPRPGTAITVAREHRVVGRMLIIDACVPEPDKDSGSVRMVNLLRALVELGWKVSFTTENRAYLAGYTEQVQALGVEMLYHPWMPEPASFLRETGTLWDVVMLSRHYVATPLLPLVRHYAPRARIVFDTVDLHYLREERAAEIEGKPELRRTAASTKLAELRLIKASDITLVVSPVEQALLRVELPDARIEVLSNVHEVVGCRRGFDERRDIYFIGGFQHEPNIDAVQWFVAEIWPRIAEQLPEVRFHIIGSRMPDAIRALASERIIATGFVETLDEYLDGCRLSVAPLRYGAGVKGKVNQSMAHGQPVVATALAAEGMFLTHDIDVLIADAPAQFADAVVRLYRDQTLWQRLSQAGLANVERHFSFHAAKTALSKLLYR